ncbi:MAG: exodeoxyribonuclease VII small subunit [Chloroflexota bacterium]
MAQSPEKVEEMSFEAAFKELETLVSALESESHALDESIKMYERAQTLAVHCSSLLEKAELKVLQLGLDSQKEIQGQV